jgi:hypothetical protein
VSRLLWALLLLPMQYVSGCDTFGVHALLCRRCTRARAPPSAEADGPQGVTSPLAGQMFFRATLFGAFGWAKRWLATNPDGSARPLVTSDFYKARRPAWQDRQRQ